jgi:tryptophanyl-tRNA synthetase
MVEENLFETNRYKINVEEKSKGGPGGYESTYLTSEGEKGDEKLYSLIKNMDDKLLPAENKAIRHRNGEGLVDALKQGKSVGIASGFKPSGPYHFGHKLTSSAVNFFQKNGAQVFVPVADIECDMDTKLSKEDYMYWAADNLLDWGANGIDLDAAHVYLQSEEFRVSTLAYLLGRSLSFESAADIYGFDKLVGDFPFMFAGVTQVGDIILPQHEDFGNYHSFMVSGQDQDGHMKMTVNLVNKSLEDKIDLKGLQTVPSAFYIPHMRSLDGNKASSSKPKGTIYLGSGREKQDLDGRIKSAQEKFDILYSDSELKDDVKRGCLDMVRYVSFFNERNSVDFSDVVNSKQYQELYNQLESASSNEDQIKAQHRIDNYIDSICRESGQDNVELVRDSIADALTQHQEKREAVYNHAINRSDYNSISEKPSFWNVPGKAVVDESKRNPTKWYNIVAASKDKLNP